MTKTIVVKYSFSWCETGDLFSIPLRFLELGGQKGGEHAGSLFFKVTREA